MSKIIQSLYPRLDVTRRAVLKGGAALASSVAMPAIVRAADVIKIGHVSPRTGPMAGFAEADDYMIGRIRELLKPGLKLGGKTYAVEIIQKDSQTDESRASEVANELALKDKVDILTACSGSINDDWP
jgi:branched-chain amino acid transport system substrate-binding protein